MRHRRPSAPVVASPPAATKAARGSLRAAAARGVEPLEPRRLLAAGDLDPTFGGGSPVLVGPPGTAWAAASDAAGRVYIATELNGAAGADLSLARVAPGGQPDTSFSGDGRVDVDLGGDERPVAVALAPDGKVLVMGSSINGQGVETTFVVRYLPNGTRDASFGRNGFAYLPTNFYANAMAVDGFGDTFLAGGVGMRGDSSAAVAKLVIDGVLDLNFGSMGFADPAPLQTGEFTDVALQGAQVVAVGGPFGSGVVARFDADGTVDTTFGSAGGATPISEFSQGVFGVEVQGDGRIVVLGVNSPGNFALRRLDAGGAVDGTFAGGVAVDTGIVADFGRSAGNLAVGAGGSIVVAGDPPGAGSLNGVQVNRYDANGAPDPTFGIGGSVAYAADIGTFYTRGVALQPPGANAPAGAAENVVVVGATSPEPGGNAVAIRIAGFEPPPFAQLDTRTGTLTVNGGDLADVVTLDVQGGTTLVAQLGPDPLFFPATGVQRVELRTGGGADVVNVGAGVAVPLLIEMGGGNNRYASASAAPATIRGGGGRDTIVGGPGNDLIETFGGADQISAGAGNDTVDTGSGGDSVDGGPGNDSLLGGDGADSLAGGDDNDTLVGRAGNDVLMGGPGADRLFGEAGNDAIMGGGGNDRLFGGADDDELSGAAGNDSLDGGDGADRLFGGDGTDTLLGGLGGDTLDGQGGIDLLFGGDGGDLLLADDGLADTLDGGGGVDIVRGDDGDALLGVELRYRVRRL